mmetsp:Transcript_25881/g.49047  ORF Transcript_25881/g.49047 Transcript_25881/m.49047 type:complete len:130 (-) Transcript_25881:1732-2121(-)
MVHRFPFHGRDDEEEEDEDDFGWIWTLWFCTQVFYYRELSNPFHLATVVNRVDTVAVSPSPAAERMAVSFRARFEWMDLGRHDVLKAYSASNAKQRKSLFGFRYALSSGIPIDVACRNLSAREIDSVTI